MNLDEIDPNGPASNEGIFGLPSSKTESRLLICPIPFDATTSYGQGTSQGPDAILKASYQKDLFHPIGSEAWKHGIFMLPHLKLAQDLNSKIRRLVEVSRTHPNETPDSEIDRAGEQIFDESKKMADESLKDGRIFSVLGGDHSVPLGSICAYSENFPKLGILHIDAHYDLRKSYEGFAHSHASIMYNVLQRSDVQSVTAVGIRDYCEEEASLAFQDSRMKSFLDDQLMDWKSEGKTWKAICDQIIESLPENVYVSFDIDGLTPSLCPNTGTPVPGGLSYHEAIYLLRQIYKSKRQIVGFDLCEVGAEEMDANIGMRVLYELCVLSIQSRYRALS